MATERQALSRERNWNIFRIKGIRRSMISIQWFFRDQNDKAAYDECDRCLASVTEILRILKGMKV